MISTISWEVGPDGLSISNAPCSSFSGWRERWRGNRAARGVGREREWAEGKADETLRRKDATAKSSSEATPAVGGGTGDAEDDEAETLDALVQKSAAANVADEADTLDALVQKSAAAKSKSADAGRTRDGEWRVSERAAAWQRRS